MRRLYFLILIFLVMPLALKASYKDYATTRQTKEMNVTKESPPTLVPGFVSAYPPETRFDHPGILKSGAETIFQTNQVAIYLKDSAETRPYFVLDPGVDPIVKNSEQSVRDPEKVLNSDLYSKTPETVYEYKTCRESKPPVEFKCSKTLIPPTIHIDPAKYSHYWCGSGNHQPDDPKCKAKKYYPVAKMYKAEKVQISPEAWSSNCGTMDTEAQNRSCKLIKTVCPKGPETREIMATLSSGQPPIPRSITRDCWHYDYTYACSYGFSQNCDHLRNSTCEQIGSICVQMRGNVCIEWEQTYRCLKHVSSSQEKVSSGGYVLPKVDSSLSSVPNADMQEAIARLSILKNIQDEMQANSKIKDINSLQIFKGDREKCTIAFAGFKNCCVKKGWGVSLGLAHCEPEEKQLALKQKNALCVKIGTYCAKKKLGICTQKKKSYCCFPSKISRILQKQGRKQLNIGWGEAEYPECRGFTVDELSRIDFEKLDLSELFAEIIAKTKKITQSTVNTVSRNLSNRVSQMTHDISKEPRFTTKGLKQNERNKPLSGEF